MTQQIAKALDVFERKILRRIYGLVQEEDGWRIRYNHELYQLYKTPRLSEHLRIMRLGWAGRVQRLEETKIPKKVLAAKNYNKRPRERPRARWEDGVAADARFPLHVRDWKRCTVDRDAWRAKLQGAMAHS